MARGTHNNKLLLFTAFVGLIALTAAQSYPIETTVANNLKDVKIIVALLSWADGLDLNTEESLWRVSSHPNVEGLIKIQLCSLHRARNSVIDSILHEAEKFAESNFTLTHLLLVHQNVIFNADDLDALIYAQKDIISGLALTKYPPYRPSFVPAKKDVDHCSTSPDDYFASKSFPSQAQLLAQHPQRDETYFQLLNQQVVEVEAASYSFTLLKLAALRKAKRIFNERGEWFYTSQFDEFFGEINCYPSLPCAKFNSQPDKTLNHKPHHEWEKMFHNQMEEEDFCFGRQMRKFGFKIHVHTAVHVQTVIPTRFGYQPPSILTPNDPTHRNEGAPIIDQEVKDQVDQRKLFVSTKVDYEYGEGVVVENRLREEKNGRKYFIATSSQVARVVVAVPSWSNINAETANKLFTLSQNINVIGRVSVKHESVTTARNWLGFRGP